MFFGLFSFLKLLEKSDPDVFVPKCRSCDDEIFHQLDALRVVQDFHGRALGAHIAFRSLEIHVFTNDDAGNFIEQSRSAAHGAGGKRGIQGALLINGSFKPSRIFQAIHFGVMNDAAALHSLVMAASDNLAVEHQNRADGDSAGSQTCFCLLNCRL